MRIIIRESKIDMLMTEYLNSWVDSKLIQKFDRFIVLEDPNGEPENDIDMEYDGEDGSKEFKWRGFSWEIRYALADWGKIWGNPTIYLEHKLLDGRMGIEPKLLLGDRIGNNGIWGLNLIYEGNLAPTKELQEREYASTASYGHIINNDVTIGVSSMYRYNDYEGSSQEIYLGPLFQYRFNGHAYLSVEVMPGLTQESKASRSTIIFAWRF
jgi:hypothetical protein